MTRIVKLYEIIEKLENELQILIYKNYRDFDFHTDYEINEKRALLAGLRGFLKIEKLIADDE